MHQAVAKLENILNLECALYQEILNIEEEKSEAIIKKSGKEIEDLSVRQEKLLTEIESFEHKRLMIMDFFGHITEKKSDEAITLSEIAEKTGGTAADNLIKTGAALKKILLKVKYIQDRNSRLLKDNMEFYDILISGLKNSSTLRSGYGSDGKEKGRIFNPVLFNIKA